MYNKIKKNVEEIKKSIEGKDITIVCASKYFSEEIIRDLYSLGITHFGESRADELLKKQKKLKDLNITWHFIGSLQSNKVKSIINEISYLHSLERASLAKAINKYRKEPLKCFIQLNLANETTKSGLSKVKLSDFYHSLDKYDKIKPIGLMQMGVYGDLSLTEEIYKEASLLNKMLKLQELSIGMSNDYLIAINSGATFLRIGSKFIS